MAHSKSIVDRLMDGAERDRLADAEHREYTVLTTRLRAVEGNHVDFSTLAARVTRFVQEDPNPVYADALVNLLLVKGYDVINAACHSVDNDTYALMVARRVSRDSRATVMVWRGTMEHNVSGPEG